jgi:glycosyltransferase involved in cell wall biosynthesis
VSDGTPGMPAIVRGDGLRQDRHQPLRRVLYAIDLDPSTKFGSMEEQIFELARAFRDRGGQFIPLFRTPLGPEASALYDAEHLRAEALDLSRFRLQTLLKIVKLVRQFRIQLVHWNLYARFNGYVWGLSVLTPGVVHWMTDHISRPPTLRPEGGRLKSLTRRRLGRRYDKVFGVSDFVVQCLRSQVAAGSLSRSYHVVNTDRFSHDEAERSRLRVTAGAEKHFVLLVVAHLIPEKGIDVVIGALRQLPEHVVLWVVGDGPDATRLRNLSRALSLDDRIRFWGQQRQVESYMQAADCLVCPSVWQEAAGLVILEALASGLPVLGSAIGGIPEFVEDGKNGFLFPAGDRAALVDRVRRLIGDPDMLGAMRTRARAMAVDRFSIDGRLSEVVDLYQA